jgi:hypothetical protein
MKAIQVNPDTFEKIEETLRPIELDNVKLHYGEAMLEGNAKIYFVIQDLGMMSSSHSRIIPENTLDRFWEGDKSETEWFEIRPKQGERQ